MSDSPATRIVAIFAEHPGIQVHIALTGADLDADDAAMVEQVVVYVAKRSLEKRAPPT